MAPSLDDKRQIVRNAVELFQLLGFTRPRIGIILGKAMRWLAGRMCAHVIVGARVPILIPSRVETAEDKLMSIALGVVARSS